MAFLSELLTRTFLKADGLGAGNGRACLGVDERAVGGLVGDDMIGGIDHEAIVAERVQNGRGLRRRLGGEFADRLLALRELVVEELGQRVVDSVGPGRDRREQRDGHSERAENGTCVAKDA